MATRVRFLQFFAVCWVLIMMSCLNDSTAAAQLTSNFYSSSCPSLQSIIRSSMRSAVQQEARMAASILRLFFHDCFVQGCDGSVLLDDTTSMQGEKNAIPNANSLRGFDVVDTIKTNVESTCPGVVSCADILALAARDAVVLSGGPTWSVLLGRRDSTAASYSQANTNLPAPFENVNALITKFQAQGLSVQDLVTLSGAHTIGQARCTNFRERLYNEDENAPLNSSYLLQLQSICPSNGSDNNLAPLDVRTSTRFDTCYYTNLINQRGLLTSDQELFSSNDSSTTPLIQTYSQNSQAFFTNFPTSMISMGNLNPLTGTSGQIRKNCRVING